MYTEQQIRGLAINFLRQHYKTRPRSGTSGTRVVPNVHYYQGVTIDARLAFQKPDLNWFTATVEATSVETAEEVIYRTNWFRIGALSVLAGLAAVGGFFWRCRRCKGLIYGSIWGGNTAYLGLLFGFLVVALITGLSLLGFSKSFRYIYAVAQFSRFHADAQWMAYDGGIFHDLKSTYFREFQRQCILYGFGMMEVLPDNKVRVVIEPSHIDQFAGKRRKLPLWVAAIQAPPALRKIMGGIPLHERLAGLNPASSSRTPHPAAAPKTSIDARDPMEVTSYLPTTIRDTRFSHDLI